LISAKYPRLAFVDLETTGGTAATDRITEVGIIEVDEDGVREWSSLVAFSLRTTRASTTAS
jgi:DNA polymerase-3 subunit epsilon